MVKENIFIIVSGPAACGKSTLVNGLSEKISAYIYQPSKAFIELAKKRNISIDRAFHDIKREDAENHFCNVCKKYKTVVGDQHLAIQHYKDSIIASGNPTIIFPDEPYVSAIDYDLFDKLTENQIYTLLIYLKASPEILYERAYNRYVKHGTYIRNQTIDEVLEEVKAEDYYFNELISRVNIDSHVIDTDYKKSNEVLENAIQRTLRFRG